MEKISGILPPSARTRVTDVSSAQPARPGAPALGRPMGRNSLGDRITLSKQMEELRQSGQLASPETPQTYAPSGEMRKTKVIEELNRQFFSNPKDVARDEDTPKSEETLKKTASNESLFFVEPELRPVQKDQEISAGSTKIP